MFLCVIEKLFVWESMYLNFVAETIDEENISGWATLKMSYTKSNMPYL